MSDDQERDATPEEQAEFFISMGIETAIDDLRLALRMNDWSEATYEEKREGSDETETIDATGRSTLKVEEALSHFRVEFEDNCEPSAADVFTHTFISTLYK